jgi:hypothetical protein
MLTNIGKILAGVIMGGLLLVGALDNVKGSPDPEAIKDNTLAKAYMDKNKERYATCYYSIHSSIGPISDVSFNYYHAGMSEAETAKIKQIEDGFIQKIKDQCENPVKKYEENYELYKSSSEQIIAANRSLFDNLINAKPEKGSSVIEYEPALVRFKSGSPFDNYIFTDEEVRQYFIDGIGY